MGSSGRPWGRALEAHWRASLLGMRLGVMHGCSGWPPRTSRPWTWYANVFTPVTNIARVAMVYVTFSDMWANLSKTSQLQTIIPAKVYEFVSSMYLLDYLSKNVGLTLIQVVMVRHSHDLSLLVRAVLLHMNSLPSQRRKYKTRAATVLCFGAAPLVYTITAIIYDVRPSPIHLGAPPPARHSLISLRTEIHGKV